MQREFYSSGQSLLIRFHSDSTETGQGFRLLYTAVSRSEALQDSGKSDGHERHFYKSSVLIILYRMQWIRVCIVHNVRVILPIICVLVLCTELGESSSADNLCVFVYLFKHVSSTEN